MKICIINGPNLNLLGKREPEVYGSLTFGIGDAIKAITTPVIEVHISNTFSRESFRHQSYISGNAKGVILGFGLQSYELAVQSFL